MKKEIAILAAVAVGSMAAGFLLVLAILGPGESRTLPDPFEGGGSPGSGQPAVPPVETGGQGVKKAASKAKPEVAPVVPGVPEVKPQAPEPPPAAPPPAPGKLSLGVGDPFVWRCWAEGQDEHLEKERCGSLPGVEVLVSDNLGLVEQCVIDGAGEGASGKLSLALKLDFSAGTIKAWLGNSTTVAEMESISACLRTAFEGKSLPDVSHDFPRYIVFFTVDVG